MSTVVERVVSEDWLVVPATWGAYMRLQKARGESAKPRYTYIDGRLTIVSPGGDHDFLKKRVGGLIEDLLIGLMIPYQPFGQTTLLKRLSKRAGTEGDECYYLNNIARIKGKRNLIMGVDPAPDLMVEVVFSHPVNDALSAYRAFGVREVWVCKPSEIEFLVLGADGDYAPSPTSAGLPFLSSEELGPWVFREDQPDEMSLRRLFRDWVGETLAPRVRAGDQAPGGGR